MSSYIQPFFSSLLVSLSDLHQRWALIKEGQNCKCKTLVLKQNDFDQKYSEPILPWFGKAALVTDFLIEVRALVKQENLPIITNHHIKTVFISFSLEWLKQWQEPMFWICYQQ